MVTCSSDLGCSIGTRVALGLRELLAYLNRSRPMMHNDDDDDDDDDTHVCILLY